MVYGGHWVWPSLAIALAESTVTAGGPLLAEDDEGP